MISYIEIQSSHYVGTWTLRETCWADCCFAGTATLLARSLVEALRLTFSEIDHDNSNKANGSLLRKGMFSSRCLARFRAALRSDYISRRHAFYVCSSCSFRGSYMAGSRCKFVPPASTCVFDLEHPALSVDFHSGCGYFAHLAALLGCLRLAEFVDGLHLRFQNTSFQQRRARMEISLDACRGVFGRAEAGPVCGGYAA